MFTRILALVFVLGVTPLTMGEEDELSDYNITIPYEQQDKWDCIIVEVCNSEGDCEWRITCP